MSKQHKPQWLLISLIGLILFCLFVLSSHDANAQSKPQALLPRDEIILMPGRVIPPPRVENPLTLKDYDIQVAVKDNVATTTIAQVFANNSQRTVEAKYLYPLPEDANFSSFSLTINGQPVEGKIMDKDEARNTYFQIVQKLIDPGLLEYVDAKTVQVSVAPILAGEEKKIKLSYTQLLKQDGGLYKYQYPFGLKAGRQLPTEQAKLDVSLQTSQPLKTIYSPTHSPRVVREGDKAAQISMSLADQKTLMEKNFVLYFGQDNQTISLNSLVFKESAEDSGYFLMTIRAPQELQNRKVLPKNLVLVIDTSGSMSGEKIVQAKEALKYIINHLRPEDHFNIVQFNTDVSLFKNELISANVAMKKAALDYAEGLNADGSTNIEGALKTAFGQIPKADARPDYVIFLTDGEPTVGITDTPGLLKTAQEANTQHARLFNFGVGYDVKTDLLGKLADTHHGTTTYVEPGENLELALTSFYTKIEAPVLTDVKVDFGPFVVSKVYPGDIGDLFTGSEVVVLGRYTRGGSGKVKLTGKMGQETKTFSYPLVWEPAKSTLHAQLPRLWAGRRIGYLLDSIHQNGESQEVKDEVIALSKHYGIITPYTSFLALEPESPGDPVPLGRPRPLSSGTMPAAAPMASLDSYRASKGKGAVQLQKSLNVMKQQASASAMNEAQMAGVPGGATLGIQTVGTKTFVLSKDGVWTDTDFDAAKHGKPQHITFGSPQYFKLLTDKPDLAKYFSLGNQVLVLFEGKAYQVVPATTS